MGANQVQAHAHSLPIAHAFLRVHRCLRYFAKRVLIRSIARAFMSRALRSASVMALGGEVPARVSCWLIVQVAFKC